MGVIQRWLNRLGFLGVSGGMFLFGFVQGTYPLSFRLNLVVAVLVVVLVQAVVSSLAFTSFLGVSLVCFARDLLGEEPTTRRSGPPVTAVVPVYRDAGVLHRSVESLLASRYEDLEVVVVCEPDDEASKRRAARLAQRDGVSRLVNTRSPGSKAGAINYAAEVTESEHLAVFDADERVHPEFVGRAVDALESHDAVQARTVPEPTGLVEELAYAESVLLSYVSRRLLYLLTGFRMVASRALVLRRSAFERVGGYDTDMLTEDFDFAYACYKERLDVTESLTAPSRIEAAHSIRDWWGQRKRWMTGYAQVLHKLLATIRPLTDYRNSTSAVICAGTVVGSLLMLTMLPKFAVLFLAGANTLFVLPFAAAILATGAVRFHDWRSGAVDRLGWAWTVVPLVFPLYSLTAIKAVLEYLFAEDTGWYHVRKGE